MAVHEAKVLFAIHDLEETNAPGTVQNPFEALLSMELVAVSAMKGKKRRFTRSSHLQHPNGIAEMVISADYETTPKCDFDATKSSSSYTFPAT